MTYQELEQKALESYKESDIGGKNIMFHFSGYFEVNYHNTDVYKECFINKALWFINEELEISLKEIYVDLEYFNVHRQLLVEHECVVTVTSLNFISYEKEEYYNLSNQYYVPKLDVYIPNHLINSIVVRYDLNISNALNYIKHNLLYYNSQISLTLYENIYHITKQSKFTGEDRGELVELLYHLQDTTKNFIFTLPFYDSLNEFLDINIINKNIVLSLTQAPSLIPVFDKELFSSLLSKVKCVFMHSYIYTLIDNEVCYTEYSDMFRLNKVIGELDISLFKPYDFQTIVRELEVMVYAKV